MKTLAFSILASTLSTILILAPVERAEAANNVVTRACKQVFSWSGIFPIIDSIDFKLMDQKWSGADRSLILARLAPLRLAQWDSVPDIDIKDGVLTIKSTKPIYAPEMFPGEGELVDFAKLLPRRAKDEYMKQVTLSYPSKASLTFNQMIDPAEIIKSFEFTVTTTIDLNNLLEDPDLVMTIDVLNRGRNYRGNMRPGESRDWIEFIAEHYANSLREAGLEVSQLRLVDTEGVFMANGASWLQNGRRFRLVAKATRQVVGLRRYL